jgi:uncharacterized alkaline shock family protein YloU
MIKVLYKIQTELGEISIEKAVLRKIITEFITKFDGKVTLANHKGQLSSIITRMGVIDENNYILIANNNNIIEIKIYIVINFGTSISMVTEQLLNDIKESIKNIAEIDNLNITIIVVGMMAKQLVRRNIEVKG